MEKLLTVKNLHTNFFTKTKTLSAVNGVDFSIERGEILGIVGESGCGKSVTSLSVLRLNPSGISEIADGEIIFKNENLLEKSEKEMCAIRGNKIAMIFQEPMTSLNPSFTIGYQVTEMIRLHKKSSRAQARSRACEMLQLVGIPDPEECMKKYPHQLSGGMRQRVMIAIALSCNPDLLIADEPTTALDVTIQAQILDLMKKIRENLNMAIILITHDLGVVAGMCDNVTVMYAGKIVEYGSVGALFENPLHPYTQGLINSIPRLDQKNEELYVIPGMVPGLDNMPKGCSFYPRCDRAVAACADISPDLYKVNGRDVRCLLYSEVNK